MARLGQFEEGFKTVTFLLVMEDGLEIYDGMDFSPETDREILNNIVKKIQEFCIGETHETYEGFIFIDEIRRRLVSHTSCRFVVMLDSHHVCDFLHNTGRGD